jgi:hypothetical protein
MSEPNGEYYEVIVRSPNGDVLLNNHFKGPDLEKVTTSLQRTISALEDRPEWRIVSSDYTEEVKLPMMKAILEFKGYQGKIEPYKFPRLKGAERPALFGLLTASQDLAIESALESEINDRDLVRQVIGQPGFDLTPCIPWLFDLELFDREIISEGEVQIYWMPDSRHNGEVKLAIKVDDKNYLYGTDDDGDRPDRVYGSIPWLKDLRTALNALDLDALNEQLQTPPHEVPPAPKEEK